MDLERIVNRAIDIAWEGAAVTLEFPGQMRVYRRMRACDTWGEDGMRLDDPRPVVQERIYAGGGVVTRLHWQIPPHVSLEI